MVSRIPATKLAHKAVAATVLCGALALGTGGIASAASTATVGSTTSSSVPAGHGCARAPRALKRITRVETAIAKRLPKLQADESKLTTAGQTKRAARVEKRITRLEKINSKATTRAAKIQTKCPTSSSS